MKWIVLVMVVFVLAGCAAVGAMRTTGTEENSSDITNIPGSSSDASDNPASPEPAAQSGSSYRSLLPNLGLAPELENTVWINSDKPLKLKDLRGSVVLIDMWTFG